MSECLPVPSDCCFFFSLSLAHLKLPVCSVLPNTTTCVYAVLLVRSLCMWCLHLYSQSYIGCWSLLLYLVVVPRAGRLAATSHIIVEPD